LKTRLGGKWLGAFWAFGEPLAHVLFVTFMLGTVRGRVMANVDFSVFLVTGVIPFALFKNLSLRLMDAIDANGIVLLLIVAGFGTGLTLAMVTHTAPASRTLAKMIFWPFYFISGVDFSVSTLPDEVVAWLLWNPVLHALELFRSNFMNAYHPVEEISCALVASFAGAMLLTGLTLYRMRRDRLLT